VGEVVLAPLVVGLVGLVAGDLKYYREEVYFDEVDDEGVR
jgi:hypothetical protein